MSIPSLPSTSTSRAATRTDAPPKTDAAPTPKSNEGAPSPKVTKLDTPPGAADTYVTFGKSDEVAQALGLIGATDRPYCTDKGTRIEDATGRLKAEIIEVDAKKLGDLMKQYEAAANATIKSLR